MGYNTDFDLSVERLNPFEEVDYDVIKIVFENVTNYKINDDFTLNEVRWYDWEKDMKEISKTFPNYRFTLDGNGEDNDDIWRAYFINGKSQVCKAKITFAPCTLEEPESKNDLENQQPKFR